jgi:hypothetical protein
VVADALVIENKAKNATISAIAETENFLRIVEVTPGINARP